MKANFLNVLDMFNRKVAMAFVERNTSSMEFILKREMELECLPGNDKVLSSVYPNKKIQEQFTAYLFENKPF